MLIYDKSLTATKLPPLRRSRTMQNKTLDVPLQVDGIALSIQMSNQHVDTG